MISWRNCCLGCMCCSTIGSDKIDLCRRLGNKGVSGTPSSDGSGVDFSDPRVKRAPYYPGYERHHNVGLGASIEQMITRVKGCYRVSVQSQETNARLTAGPHSRKVWIFHSAWLRGDNSTPMRTIFNALRDQVDPTIAAISTVMICHLVAACGVVTGPRPIAVVMRVPARSTVSSASVSQRGRRP